MFTHRAIRAMRELIDLFGNKVIGAGLIPDFIRNLRRYVPRRSIGKIKLKAGVIGSDCVCPRTFKMHSRHNKTVNNGAYFYEGARYHHPKSGRRLVSAARILLI